MAENKTLSALRVLGNRILVNLDEHPQAKESPGIVLPEQVRKVLPKLNTGIIVKTGEGVTNASLVPGVRVLISESGGWDVTVGTDVFCVVSADVDNGELIGILVQENAAPAV